MNFLIAYTPTMKWFSIKNQGIYGEYVRLSVDSTDEKLIYYLIKIWKKILIFSCGLIKYYKL